MKRLRRSDSMAGLIPICPTTSEEYSPRRTSDMYGFQSMLGNFDEDSSINVVEYSGCSGGSEKKRRLGIEQVKALEKNFELENKLEPERKVKLAQELGLQPRQVAVWFQNRRARWKTKQLERDYGSLKAEYDALRVSHDALRRDNHALLRQISQLKAKLNGEDDNNNINPESEISVKEEDVEEEEEGEEIGEMQSETLEQLEPSSSQPDLLEVPTGFKYDGFNCGGSIFPSSDSFKDGSSDSSDSSTVLNEGNSPIPAAASSTETAAAIPAGFFRFVKMETAEADDLFGGDAACGFFSDEQPPSLSWYSSADQWN